ncbi:hypothetical protein J6590_080146 [Homalodisca vitripennis]|nr:hypothetical protein J6590_080146 [Homalodisca vitripennis]
MCGSGLHKGMPYTLKLSLSPASTLHTRTGGPSVYTPVSFSDFLVTGIQKGRTGFKNLLEAFPLLPAVANHASRVLSPTSAAPVTRTGVEWRQWRLVSGVVSRVSVAVVRSFVPSEAGNITISSRRKLKKQTHEANSRSNLAMQAHEAVSLSKFSKQSHEDSSRRKLT